MNQACVAEAMFEFQRQFDSVREILAANKGNERHHLFFRNERVRRIGLAVEQLRRARNSDTN